MILAVSYVLIFEIITGPEDLSCRIPIEKRISIARYHGTVALKITNDNTYIWRDHRWIKVREE